jgi:efflux transporter, RND family, MFP subunit
MKKVYLTVSLFLVIVLTGCQNAQKQVVMNESVNVELMQVATGQKMSHKRFSGTVEEESGTTLSFSVAGTVKSVHVTLGERVVKGELIATLDPVSVQSSYNAAKAALEQAEDAYRRMKELHDKGSLPEMQWVDVQSKLQQARSLEEIAGKSLKDCKLYAPFSGVVAEKLVDAGQNVAPGIPVARLITAGLLKVKIAVPETEIAGISLAQKAEVRVSALGDRKFSGMVVEKGIVAHPLSRSYDVKIRVDSPGAELMPGMVTEVVLEEEPSSSVSDQCVIPANIVQLDENNRSFVWIEEAGKARKCVITCGDFTANGIVVTSGLKNGDRIIVEGQHKVCEGTNLAF